MKSCERCWEEPAMPFEVPARISGAKPDSRRLAEVRKTFTATAAPVRPLPSNATMMTLCLAVFIALGVLLAMPVGFYGFAKMNTAARWMEYSVLLLLALVLAGGVVEQMIPGSRRTMRPVWGILFSIVLLSVTTLLLFPDFDTTRFVPRGIGCLRYGLLSSIPAAGLTWVLMRRGFITDPLAGAVWGGALSGLLGTAALALHCPIFSAPHIVVWHAGVIVVTSVAGACIGFFQVR
jgi:hypothetical protein